MAIGQGKTPIAKPPAPARGQPNQEGNTMIERTEIKVKVGSGKTVHSGFLVKEDGKNFIYIKCGAGGVGSGQVRWKISQKHIVNNCEVTCKKCLK